jgi:hypothetical protein
MHPAQHNIVAPVAEMGHAAFIRPQVPHWHTNIMGRHALPAQSHRGLRIEIVAPHPTAGPHDLDQRHDGIDAEAEQRITDAVPQRLQIGAGIGEAAAPHAHQRCLRAKDRLPEDQRVRLGRGQRHEMLDAVGRVLAIRIHGQGVGEALGGRCLQPMQHGGALALVAGQYQHPQPAIAPRHGLQLGGRAVRAAIHHDPDRIPVCPGRPHRLQHQRTTIIGWDQYEMRSGGSHHAGSVLGQASQAAYSPKAHHGEAGRERWVHRYASTSRFKVWASPVGGKRCPSRSL